MVDLGSFDPEEVSQLSIVVTLYLRVAKVFKSVVGTRWISLKDFEHKLSIEEDLKFDYEDEEVLVRFEVGSRELLVDKMNLEVFTLEKSNFFCSK